MEETFNLENEDELIEALEHGWNGVHARLTKPELKTALRRAAFAQRLLELSR